MIRCKSHVRTSQTVSDQLEHIMVVRQTSCGRRNSKVSVLWQDNVLRPDTHLKVLVVVRHPVVEENGQGVLEVLNLGSHLTRWCFSGIPPCVVYLKRVGLTGKGLFLKSLRQPASCWVEPSF